MRCLIFYHDDVDGWCSAFVLAKAIREGRFAQEYRIPNTIQLGGYVVDYHNKELVIDKINLARPDIVVLLDFCYQPLNDLIVELNKNSCQLFILIDHHKSTIEYLNDMMTVDCASYIVHKEGVGACELVFDKYFDGEKKPWVLRAISGYDVFKFFDKNKQLSLIYYLEANRDIYSNPFVNYDQWDDLFSKSGKSLSPILKQGETAFRYWLQSRLSKIRNSSFEIELSFKDKKYKVLAVNDHKMNTIPFEHYDVKREYDIYLAFTYNGSGIWTVSLYTLRDDIDCSEIAKSFGGGGHPKAAGFQCKIDILDRILNF